MLSGSEFMLLLLIVFLIFGLHKWPAISGGIARLRLHFDKGLAEEYIEASPEDEDSEVKGTGTADSTDNRGS